MPTAAAIETPMASGDREDAVARLPRVPGIRKIVLDLHARFANIAQTTLYVTIEAPLQKSVDRHRRPARHLLEVDGSAEHVGQRMGNRLPVEQLLAREHLCIQWGSFHRYTRQPRGQPHLR
jgi:hypothetical protein